MLENATKNNEVLLEVEGLKKNFGKNEVLSGIDAKISRGEKIAVIGPSGSGKSTFLRCLNLLEQPTEGDILFEGDLDSRQEFIECMREAAHLGGPSARYVYASVRSHFADIYIGNAIKQLNHSIFIIGSDSEESREAVQEYIAYNPAIESEIIEGTRLLIQQEKPEQVLELCRMFLA